MAFWETFYWDDNTEILELQGAEITFVSDSKDVIYKNLFYPSGFTLARWSSKVDYGATYRFNSLPTLIPGHTYRLTTSMTANGLTPYLALTFYTADNEILWTTDRYDNDRQIEVPVGADRYLIEIVAYGEGSFTFHNFTIQEVIAGGNLVPADWYHEFPTGERLSVRGRQIGHPNKLVVVFAEPLPQQTPYVTHLQVKDALVMSVADQRFEAGHYLPETGNTAYEETLFKLVNDAADAAHIDDIIVAGVGPISRAAADYYGNKNHWRLVETAAPSVQNQIGFLKQPNINAGHIRLED